MRATEPGLFAGIDGRPEPPEGAYTREGGFSLVTDTSGGRVKKLPSYYVNTSQLYAHRDTTVVNAKLRRAVELFQASAETPTYMVTACEIAGRKGLYGTDFFNRSAYRQQLKRLGMRFSDDPFARFDGTTFTSDDFEAFEPEFLTLPRRSDNPPGVVPMKGALLVHRLTFYRIADIGPQELSTLVQLAGRIDALSATEAADLAAALSGG